MNIEHGIIVLLVIALLYYLYTHGSLINDLMNIPHDNNPQLKMVKDKHLPFGDFTVKDVTMCLHPGYIIWDQFHGNTCRYS